MLIAKGNTKWTKLTIFEIIIQKKLISFIKKQQEWEKKEKFPIQKLIKVINPKPKWHNYY